MMPHELTETDFRKTHQSRENQRAFIQPALKERRADPEGLIYDLEMCPGECQAIIHGGQQDFGRSAGSVAVII
jgi:hypothetical protein